MTTGEKIAKLRKDNNYTQEQLAEVLNVSRQSVSKWESDIAYPETDKLIRLGKLFHCSMDYLLKEEITDPSGAAVIEKKSDFYSLFSTASKKVFKEHKSEKMLCGMPLYHIGKNAKGFFALGFKASGVISIGFLSKGILSFGICSLGVLSMGVCALGLLTFGAFALGLFALGAIAAGIFAAGGISLGIVAIGGVAAGLFSVGGIAAAKYLAIGDHAYGMIALGQTEAVGSIYRSVASVFTEQQAVRLLVSQHIPNWLSPCAEFLLYVFLR